MLPTTPGDAIETLIQRCLRGDQVAWELIVRQYWRKVFNVAYKFVGKHDEAEDLTQDIFLKIFKSLDTFDRRANFQTWLISISRNLCIDHYRSVRKERETIDRDVDAERADAAVARPGPGGRASSSGTGWCCCGRRSAELPETLRTAVLMRDIQELSYQEIADKLRLPEGTVKSRINRGRTELARQIRKLRGDDIQASRRRGPKRPDSYRSAHGSLADECQNRAVRRHLDRPRRRNAADVSDPVRFLVGGQRLVAAGKREILIDLTPVTYVDSATIGCLMDLYRQVHGAGGHLKLSGVQKRVETMLTMTGAQNFIEIHADEPSAVKSFGA